MSRFLKVVVLKTNLIERLNEVQDIDVSVITDIYPIVEGEINTLIVTTSGSFYIKETILELINQFPQLILGKVTEIIFIPPPEPNRPDEQKTLKN